MSRIGNTRRMMMRWPDLDRSVRVELFPDECPTLAPLVWDALPFRTIQGHALITGQMLFATSPVISLVRENVKLFTNLPPGACYYGNPSQNIGVIYGRVTEPEGHSIWGQVDHEDLSILREVGEAVWENLLRPFGSAGAARTKRAIILECSRLDE